MASGRVSSGSFCLEIHASKIARGSSSIRTPISVPLPVVIGRPRFFIILTATELTITLRLSQKQAEWKGSSFSGYTERVVMAHADLTTRDSSALLTAVVRIFFVISFVAAAFKAAADEPPRDGEAGPE